MARLKPPAPRPMPTSGTMSVPTPPMATWSVRRSQGPDRLDRPDRTPRRASRARHRHGGERRQARQGQLQYRQAARWPARSSTTIRRSPSSSPRRSSRRARAAQLVGVDYVQDPRAFDLAARERLRDQARTGYRRLARHCRRRLSTARLLRRPSSSMRPTPRRTSRTAMMEPHASIAA